MGIDVFVVMPFKEPYDSIYKQAIEPELRACGLQPIRADEIDSPGIVHDQIVNKIIKSSLVIIEASESNRNVYYEFGVAAAYKKESIILAKRGSELPFDTQHLRHILYDPEELVELRDTLRRWLKNTAVYHAHENRREAQRLVRGDVLPDIVDASFLIQRQRPDSWTKIADYVVRGAPIPCQYIYAYDRGTLRWLDLCNDPLYEVFHSSIEFLSNNAARIIDALGDDLTSSFPDYISLGPGNGHKDRLLLRALLGRLRFPDREEQIYYYPCDINLYMLSTAVRTITASQEISRAIRVKAACAEFQMLPLFSPVYNYRPVPNMFVFLGNTLGNMSNEVEFLRQLRTAMLDGDVLIIEVRAICEGMENPGGTGELRKRFNFTPLEALGIWYDPEKLVYEIETGCSQIPGAMSVTGKYLDYEFSGHKIEGTTLTVINHYDLDEMANTLRKGVGFTIVEVFRNSKLGIFVLRK